MADKSRKVKSGQPTIKVPKRAVKDFSHETFSDLVFRPRTIRYEHQNADEQILMVVREHIVVLFARMFSTIVLAVIPFVLLWIYQYFYSRGALVFTISTTWWIVIVVLWYLGLVSATLKIFVDWFYNVNIMTTQRFMDIDFSAFSGFRVKETPIMKIQDAVNSQVGPWQMVFDMGALTIFTASAKTTFELHNVPAASQVRDFVMDTVIAYTDQFKSDDIINAP